METCNNCWNGGDCIVCSKIQKWTPEPKPIDKPLMTYQTPSNRPDQIADFLLKWGIWIFGALVGTGVIILKYYE